MLTSSVTYNIQNSCYFRCPVWKLIKLIKSKFTRKLRHTNSILEYFEYFCQISSKLILLFSSYTISKFTCFLRPSVQLYIITSTAATITEHVVIWCSGTNEPFLRREILPAVWSSTTTGVISLHHCVSFSFFFSTCLFWSGTDLMSLLIIVVLGVTSSRRT